jgi:hypothetical protein
MRSDAMQAPPHLKDAVGPQALQNLLLFSYSTDTKDEADDDDGKRCR